VRTWDGALAPKHVAALCITLICGYYSAFGWCNKLTVLIKTAHGVDSFKMDGIGLVNVVKSPLKSCFFFFVSKQITVKSEQICTLYNKPFDLMKVVHVSSI
jgi:hypothetical protein